MRRRLHLEIPSFSVLIWSITSNESTYCVEHAWSPACRRNLVGKVLVGGSCTSPQFRLCLTNGSAAKEKLEFLGVEWFVSLIFLNFDVLVKYEAFSDLTLSATDWFTLTALAKY